MATDSSVATFTPPFSYWNKLTSKRPMATVLLGNEDDVDDNGLFFNRVRGQSESIITLAAPNDSPNPNASKIFVTNRNDRDFDDIEDMPNVPPHSVDNLNADNEMESYEGDAQQSTTKTSNSANEVPSFGNSMAYIDNVDETDGPTSITANVPNIPNTPSNITATMSTANTQAYAQCRARTLNTFDLTNVGLSATLAIGIFLMVGYVIRHVAGPATILSIIIAAACSFLAGMKVYLSGIRCTC